MKIEKRKYSGYVWMSDKDHPEKVLHNEEYCLERADDANPFVIEAQLYSSEDKVSVSVKYVDGKYIVKEYENVSPKSVSDTITLKEYDANSKIGGVLQFLQYWDEKDDDEVNPLRCGMKELRPGKLVFVGFKKKEA